jgi:hypothetical protein
LPRHRGRVVRVLDLAQHPGLVLVAELEAEPARARRVRERVELADSVVGVIKLIGRIRGDRALLPAGKWDNALLRLIDLLPL